MKNITINGIRAVLLGGFLASASVAMAQSTTVQTTTTSNGIISDFSPSAMTVRTETSSSPINYTFSKTTTYVDESGNPVSVETVRSGAPVTVYYTQDGDQMVASKVVVRKSVTTDVTPPAPAVIEKKTSTTTTTTGPNP